MSGVRILTQFENKRKQEGKKKIEDEDISRNGKTKNEPQASELNDKNDKHRGGGLAPHVIAEVADAKKYANITIENGR